MMTAGTSTSVTRTILQSCRNLATLLGSVQRDSRTVNNSQYMMTAGTSTSVTRTILQVVAILLHYLVLSNVTVEQSTTPNT